MRRIALKLWSGMMLLVLVVLILLWLFQVVFLENFYLSMRITDIKNEGMALAELYTANNKEEFESRAEIFAFNNNLSFELVDIGGNPIYVSQSAGYGSQTPLMRNNARIEAYSQAVNGKEFETQLTHPRFGNKFILIGVPYKIQGRIAGAFIINMPLAPVKDTTSILKKQLVYITVILLLASVIISFIISKTFTKPILEIKMVSEKMASGDFSNRIKSKNRDEIGSLADTINYMGQELSKIDQLRKDLIANVSHELRTPLSIIRGYAETIRDVTGNNPEKRDRQTGIIIEESERLSKIVDDMLNLSQLQAGNIKLNQERFIINEIIESVVKRYDILIEKTGIKLVVQRIPDITVMGDMSRIEQVLYNLINNAFNHTPKGGTIT